MGSKNLNLQAANEFLDQHVQNPNLKKHCVAVGKVLAAYFDYYLGRGLETDGLDKDQWEIVGLLHDSDWEETKNNPAQHTIKLLDWLKEYSAPEEMLNVFRSHNHRETGLREPQTLLEKTLECCDELTGFIVAVALVRPDKKLAGVETQTILKKFKQKEFARQVNRTQISECEAKLSIPLDTFVKISLNAMKQTV